MKQTKRSDSHLGSPDCYNPVKEYWKDAKTFSDRKTLKDFSDDLRALLEEAVKKLELSDSPKNIDEDHNTVFKSKISREILDISTQYSMQFSIISCQFEKWSAQRRMLIKKIDNIQISLNQTKTNCAKTRMVFSTIDISGTLGSAICDNLNVSWSPKLLFASAAFGCLSLVCSLIEMSQTKSSVEEALRELGDDSEGLRNLQILFQQMKDFDRSVRDLFPHGVDTEIVRMFQDSDERSPNSPRGIHALIKAFPTSKLSKKIWLSIILTNALKDTSILDDEDFLLKADVFSKSPVAEIWWKRMKSKEFPATPKSALEADLKSCLNTEFPPLHAAPLLSTPFWASGLHTIGSVLVNALVVYDSYSEL
ncbi:hypothetical protein JTE90_011738, partial [Oedothorax gibbosus]